MSSPTVKLNSGHQMPLVGFGLWKVNNDTCADQVYNAIKTGYRLLDGKEEHRTRTPDTSADTTTQGASDYGNESKSNSRIFADIES